MILKFQFPDLSDLKSEDELIPNFFRVAYSFKMIVEANMKKINDIRNLFSDEMNLKITKQQVIILLRLTIVEQISPSNLAESLGIHLPNLMVQISKLEKSRLIEKIPDKEDKRGYHIRILDASIKILEKLPDSLDLIYLSKLGTLKGKRRTKILQAHTVLLDYLKEELPEVVNAVYTHN